MSTSNAIESLRNVGEEVPADLRDAIIAAGEASIPGLIAIIEDRSALMEDSPSQGWAPIHAVDLLAELKAEAAIGPMLQLLADSTTNDIVHDRICGRLPAIGAAVVEPTLAAYAQSKDDELRISHCFVLAKAGVRDERIFSALVWLFDLDVVMGAICLGDYGDRRAAPMLEQAILAYRPMSESEEAITPLVDLFEAYQKVDGPRYDEMHDYVNRMIDAWESRSTKAAAPARNPWANVGRNDPCPCGSGKKFKKCHFGQEPPSA